ncbi:hypothetical protein LBMAG53_14110 [Planctomycetota bacterium]|nr:hypothetical protein LBMAG53_14110 [Planctomycetota bacterium]
MTSVYLDLTREFNHGRTRAVLSSGQAVVFHRLAIMSKDGDWIIREDEEALDHLLAVLARHNATCRCGAPLDRRWLEHGWSSHFEFSLDGLRVRTDFVSRPPRLGPAPLAELWSRAEGADPPVIAIDHLIELKKTNRERDYAVIGELARRLTDPRSALRQSRSARDLLALVGQHPELLAAAAAERPALTAAADGEDALGAALDSERRQLIKKNEERLALFLAAAQPWRQHWIALERSLVGLPLAEAHRRLVAAAEIRLPQAVPGGWP